MPCTLPSASPSERNTPRSFQWGGDSRSATSRLHAHATWAFQESRSRDWAAVQWKRFVRLQRLHRVPVLPCPAYRFVRTAYGFVRTAALDSQKSVP